MVILGAQRAGTTSLFDWLATHPKVAPSTTKEVHYFDRHYAEGERWYRAHFPLRGVPRLSVEATPYLLFYPPAPRRVATDLPPTTRFVVLLRDPVQRAISQYWHSCRLGAEDQPLDVALALEDERLAGQDELVASGGESFAHRNFSYKARGHYAPQLRRWFGVIERERFLVMESEELWSDPGGPGRVLHWLGLSPNDHALSRHQRRPASTSRGGRGRRRPASPLRSLQRGPVRAVGEEAVGALTTRHDDQSFERAWTAAHMASTGTARPVQRSRASAAWCTSIPSPPTARAPAGLRGAQQRRDGRVVDEVDDHLPGVQRVGVEGHPPRFGSVGARPCPTAWPGRRARRPSTSAPDPTRPTAPDQRGGPLGAWRRPVHHHHLGRAGLGQGQDDGSRRAPGADHQTPLRPRIEPGGTPPARPGTPLRRWSPPTARRRAS